MKKILIIAFTDLSRDPRVNRQIIFLKDKYLLSTVGLKSVIDDNQTFLPLVRSSVSLIHRVKKAFFCKIGLYERVYWNDFKFDMLMKELSSKKYDLIISNDIESLPFALKVANTAKILLDAHEYTPQEFEDRFLWKFFLQDYKRYLCKKYIKHCDKITTVSNGIADAYNKNYGIKPIVISNACEYIKTIKPSPTDEQNIMLIHHGVTSPSRKLEIMIKMMDYLDNRFKLDIMLVNTDLKYLKYLKNLAKGKNHIRFIGPVPLKDIVIFTNQYDIGIFILPPTNLSYKYAFPNKLFEFIHARLVVAVGPSLEMAEIVKRYDCGIVAEDYEAETMAKELNKLTKSKIDHYKSQSGKAAQYLSLDKDREKFQNLVSELLN